MTTHQDLMAGPPPTLLPEDEAAFAALESGQSPADVAAGHPTYALAWALAGPVAAVFALNRLQGGDAEHRTRERLVVAGALVSTITPALFNMTNRTGLGLAMWYAATALGAATALMPLASSEGSWARLRRLHRI